MGDYATSHAARSRLIPFFLVAALLLPCALGNYASGQQVMKIDDVPFDNGAVVKFLLIGSDQVPVGQDALKKMIAGSIGDNSQYTVFADLDSIRLNPSFENYDFYVRAVTAATNAPLTRFTFQVTPYDAFPDQNRKLQIHLLDGTQDRTGELTVPLHSLKAGNSLLARVDSRKVRLSGDTISIELENKYPLPVTITDAKVEQVLLAHWIAQPVLKTPVPFVLNSDENNHHATLVWQVQPRAWGVLRDSVWPFSTGPQAKGGGQSQSSEDLETLDFSIDYVPTQGGFPHTLKPSRGVSFYPSLPALLSVAMLGAIGGGLVMFFGVRGDSGPLKFLNYLWPNVLLAVIIELIAIQLFSFDNSKIQIGSVNLNPTLLIPATCLGAISVFYGFQLVEKWLGKAGPKAPAAAAEGDK